MSDGAKPWKARYYEAQAVVEAAAAELAALGLGEHDYDVKNRDARQCRCGQWVAFSTWAKPAGPVTCEACTARQLAEVRGDEREEKGLPRDGDVPQQAPGLEVS
jgi:hypothetical protein